MGLHVIGINHHTAPLELREQVAFDATTLSAKLKNICALDGVEEALVLSTCNRTEIYCYGSDATEDSLKTWMLQNSNRSDEVMKCLYVKRDDDVIEHLCRVAVGLDSLILGEPQILGQLKTAFRLARDSGTVAAQLHRLLPHAFAVAKRIRTETAIGVASTSAASASIRLAQQVFGEFSNKHALMIGAGEMIEIAATHLKTHNVGTLSIANRSEGRGRKLAKTLNCSSYTLDKLPELLPKADLIFSSTASPDYVVQAEELKQALSARKRRPMFIVDLAVPRDIDPASSEFDDVFLYTIDDLHQAVDENLDARREAAKMAESIIAEHGERYARDTDGLDAAPLISDLHAQSNEIKRELLEQAEKHLNAGKAPMETVQWMADRLANRLLHVPSIEMRKAAEEADEQVLEVARRFFGRRGRKL
ncbi:MAG: glutamyl-tRNA reductase [Gammaproteobacteria bacterium]